MARRSYLGGGKYSYKPAAEHRSGLEDNIAQQIKRAKKKVSYEEYSLQYVIPASEHTYTPDFILPNNIIIEAKGIFDIDDRKKHLLVREMYPHLDIRFVFSNPNHKLYKGAKSTYAQWCQKHGYQYAKGLIPSAWFDEPKGTRCLDGLQKKKGK